MLWYIMYAVVVVNMVYFKVVTLTLLCACASTVLTEPPVPGYNYQQPGFSSFPASNSYLPPRNDFNTPSNTYLPSSSGSIGYDHHHHHENEVPKAYEFGYAVKDAHSGNDYQRREKSDGNVVRGEYRVQLPDGRMQIVTYHADWKTGFHADVRYEGEARYPEPTHNTHQGQGGYNYNAPAPAFTGSLSGFHGNQGFKPSPVYGPAGYH